jgi:hypothetical protein
MPSQAAPQQPSKTQATTSFPTGKQSLGSETGPDGDMTQTGDIKKSIPNSEEDHTQVVAMTDLSPQAVARPPTGREIIIQC